MSSKALIVDDEKIICTGLSRELKSEGFDVDWALEGEDALRMIEEDGFELAIVDFMLPDMSGLEICKRIKMINEKMKIIVMSGYLGILDQKKPEFDLIAEDIQFIYKPFEKREILNLIEKVF